MLAVAVAALKVELLVLAVLAVVVLVEFHLPQLWELLIQVAVAVEAVGVV
jgi:hypothetical protein